ncbi:MAG: hypothetical protein L6R42_001799 [Xanthoria sp. 1 TBL-2021]|nr:MAG: hypothetical protein L6R42_001799 [Xanthoria sp. 1 TBL-2021]
MAVSKPTLVLVHGGWHTPETYSAFTSSLRSAGFEVHVPRLPSMNGARPPNTDLATDTALVHDYVESLVQAGREVVAILHSYGGQVGTNALYGLQRQDSSPGGVTHLIYMSAFALPEGGSMVGKVKEFGHEHLLPLAFDFAEDDSCLNRDPKTLLVGPGAEDAEADAYISSLVRWNGKSMYQEVTRCAWREIPTSYIYTSQDMTVPLDYQKSMVDHMKAEGQEVQTFELDTGHCPNLTKTKEVVEIVKEIVSGHSR